MEILTIDNKLILMLYDLDIIHCDDALAILVYCVEQEIRSRMICIQLGKPDHRNDN